MNEDAMAYPALRQTTFEEADALLRDMAEEAGVELRERRSQIKREIATSGTYQISTEELEFAAKIAWRNNARCIGRRMWKNLIVRDLRHLRTEEEIFEGCVEHLRVGYNDGKLRPVLTVFAPRQPGQPGIRLWNHQLIRYAGYRQADGSVIGDSHSVELTERVMAMGWKGGGGHFDILPLVVQLPGGEPTMFELPEDVRREVPISHPEHEWFADLGLRWYAVPALCDMALDAAGLQFTAAPFSGWYMGTEIAARNFGDESRYNLLPLVARRLGLDTSSDRTLWKDRALVELNIAVLHSYKKHGVAMVDHHAATRDFMRFVDNEETCGRTPYTDWSWIVPPVSGSACPVFHRDFEDRTVKPNYFYQKHAWKK
jgi:nitric-oxide synthase